MSSPFGCFMFKFSEIDNDCSTRAQCGASERQFINQPTFSPSDSQRIGVFVSIRNGNWGFAPRNASFSGHAKDARSLRQPLNSATEESHFAAVRIYAFPSKSDLSINFLNGGCSNNSGWSVHTEKSTIASCDRRYWVSKIFKACCIVRLHNTVYCLAFIASKYVRKYFRV